MVLVSTNSCNFKKTLCNNFLILTWNINKSSPFVDYLDFTIQIAIGRIVTKYQKPMNLHQYTTSSSAHPPWMTSGIISTMIRTYFYQNINCDHYWKIITEFINTLKQKVRSEEPLTLCLSMHTIC